MILSESLIASTLAAYGVEATSAQCQQVRTYISLLLKWNKSISLTTITEESEILKFHFGESVFALSAVRDLRGRLADVGSGAGFPGIPLLIFRDAIDLTLIDSNSKKCAFLSEVVREIGLRHCRVKRARFEDLEDFRGKLDGIVSRALGGYDGLLRWAQNALSATGRIALWLGEEDCRVISRHAEWQWENPSPIPGSKRRFILSGSPIRATR